MIKKKPNWLRVRKFFRNSYGKPVGYTECHDGPGTAVYYFFNKLYYYSWPELEKAANEIVKPD